MLDKNGLIVYQAKRGLQYAKLKMTNINPNDICGS